MLQRGEFKVTLRASEAGSCRDPRFQESR